MDPDALAESITVDRTQGARPFLVVSTAGTTNTGAVDPLPAISQICQREQLWHHVDAAYGGAFVLCEQGRVALAGIDAADSIAFDPHKGMFLPYGTGCLLVADGERLRRAHQVNAAYLQDFDAHDRSGEPPSPSDYGPELSRDYRGLRLWLPLMLHGVRAFRDALTEKLALTREFARQLRTQMDAGVPIELVDDPQLTVAAFRLARAAGEPLAAWNHRNAAWLARINARARVCLSSTALPVADGEAFTLRACVLSFRTHAPVLDACLQDVLATLR
jgi:aromatic-L-amino-acid decarboxylase